MQRMSTIGPLLILAACAGRSKPDVDMIQDPRCVAVADTISKYISQDALPAAQIVGDESLRRPELSRPGDSVVVDFVVWPTGIADTSSVQVVGINDPQFVRTVVRFAAENRFRPAQVSGCNVVSRYSVVMR